MTLEEQSKVHIRSTDLEGQAALRGVQATCVKIKPPGP